MSEPFGLTLKSLCSRRRRGPVISKFAGDVAKAAQALDQRSVDSTAKVRQSVDRMSAGFTGAAKTMQAFGQTSGSAIDKVRDAVSSLRGSFEQAQQRVQAFTRRSRQPAAEPPGSPGRLREDGEKCRGVQYRLLCIQAGELQWGRSFYAAEDGISLTPYFIRPLTTICEWCPYTLRTGTASCSVGDKEYTSTPENAMLSAIASATGFFRITVPLARLSADWS